jgi:hypothetical protein
MKATTLRLVTHLTTTMLLLVTFLMSGCSVTMKHDDLMPSSQQYSDPINMSKSAEGIDGKVGWGRFTMFYIPIIPVYINGEGNELVMKQIQDALKQVGYQVASVDTEKTTNTPILKCKVNKFWFNNYTWIFPFIPTWGDINLAVSLVSTTGQVLWSQEFKGDGFTLNFFNGYTSAAEQSMTEVLNEMVKAFSSDAFHTALVNHT